MRRCFSMIDQKTNLEMIVSEASYNMACSFLEGQGFKCETAFVIDKENWITEIRGEFKDGTKRTFFYDETRGILLGE